MKNKAAMPLQRQLLGIVIVLISFSLFVLFVMQGMFTMQIGKIYRDNVDITMEQVAADVQKTFTQMNDSVENLSDNSAIREYVTTQSSAERYQKANDAIRPIVTFATANMNFDHLLIADRSGSWFRFLGGLSSKNCDNLRSFFWDEPSLVNTVLTLDDSTYFCTAKRIRIIDAQQADTVGLVVALTHVDKTRQVLQMYEGYHNISIILHDNQTIFLSLNPELEKMPFEQFQEQNSQNYILQNSIFPDSLFLAVSVPKDAFYPQRAMLTFLFLSAGVISLLGILLLAMFINRMLVRPFQKVVLGTKQLSGGELCKRLPETGVPYVNMLVHSINDMLGRLEGYSERELSSMQEIYELEITQQKTQMYLLRHQIDRHFLYNSLVSIRALSESGETEKAGQVAAGIARLLQYTSSKAEEVNLFDEMEIIHLYVKIQNIRFDNRIRFEVDVDDRLCEYKTLRLLVQPLVENALIHGLEQRVDDCLLRVRGYLHDGIVYIEVYDNGAGMPAGKLADIQNSLLHTDRIDIIDGLEGIALLNVQKRIYSKYGNEYGLTISSTENMGTTVRLCVPAIPEE